LTRRGTLVLLTALVGVGPLTTDLYLPSLPGMARAFATTPDKVQLTLILFMAAYGLAQLIYGPLSDRYGRRPVLLGGLALFVVTSAICALASSIGALIALRVGQALGACGAPVLARAIVRDLFEGAAAVRALSLVGAAMALVPVLAPIAGGFLEEAFGWRAGFLLLAALGAILLASTWATLDETNRRPSAEPLTPGGLALGYGRLLASRTYVGFVVGVGGAFAGLALFLAESSFVLIDAMGLTPSAFGLAFAVVSVGYMTGNLLSARLAGRHSSLRLARIGIALCLAGASAMSLAWVMGADRPAAVILPMALYMIGFGLVMPNGVAGAIAPWPERAGAASAFLGFCQMFASAVAVFIASRIPHDDQSALALGTAIVAGIGLLAFTWLVPREAGG
jgi:MFS transporter, DHA1 family, multidrug resistance protein